MHFEAIRAIDTHGLSKREDRRSAWNQSARFPIPRCIMQLALAYRSSAVLFAAVELDVFTPLADGPQDGGGGRARACSAPSRADAAAARGVRREGLLTPPTARYTNTPVADAFLVAGRPAYSANGLKYAEDLYPAWGRLADLVRRAVRRCRRRRFSATTRRRRARSCYAMHERAHGHRLGAAAPADLDRPPAAARCRRRSGHVLGGARAADARTDGDRARRARRARSDARARRRERLRGSRHAACRATT